MGGYKKKFTLYVVVVSHEGLVRISKIKNFPGLFKLWFMSLFWVQRLITEQHTY